MKKFIFILILLPAETFSQVIPKGTNAIFVGGVSYTSVINAFLDKNYRIEEANKDFQTATLIKIDHPAIKIELRVKDSTCIFREFVSGYRCYFASKGDAPAFRKDFEMLDSLVKGISDKITYSKE